MYSLTQATQILLVSFNEGTNNSKCERIIKYNNHKVRHTFGVLETGRNLLIKIKENTLLMSEIVNKAEVCFILHDVGRFFQNDGNKVFENKDYDHGDKSYEIVKNNNYSLDICLAIKYHNKYSVDGIFEEKEFKSMNDSEKNDTIFLLNILKDADKLQNMIYSIFDSESYFIIDKTAWNVKQGDITIANLNDVENHRLVNRANVNTFGDYYLATLSFIFDLNFIESFGVLNFYGYIDKSLEKIEKSPGVSRDSIEKIKKSINKFISKL